MARYTLTMLNICFYAFLFAMCHRASGYLTPSSSSRQPVSTTPIFVVTPSKTETKSTIVARHGLSARSARIMTPISVIITTLLGPRVALAAKPSGDAFGSSLQKFFPGALQSSVIALRVLAALRKRNYRQYNMILGTSLCSDEINTTPESLVTSLANVLVDTKSGGVFQLGGLGGIPFVGTSGFNTFVSHCPENGRLLILFGPHVGISQNGNVGIVEHIGQIKAIPSCAAVTDAVNAANKQKKDASNSMDFQQEYVNNKLRARLEGITNGDLVNNGDRSIADVTNQMYDVIYELLRSQIDAATVKEGFWTRISEITLLGGVVINRGHGSGTLGGQDYFQPLVLKTLKAQGEDDLYAEVFGDLTTPRRK